MYHIIVNPVAGNGGTVKQIPFITNLFDNANMQYEVLLTEGILDGYEKTKAICKKGSLGIIGVGGDGTIQEIIAGMADIFPMQHIPIPLGVYPAGSGKDLYMSLVGKKAALQFYKDMQTDKAARQFFKIVKENRTKAIDYIVVNDMAYLNIGNIGLDARIVKNASAVKQKYGRYAYIAAVYKSILQHTNMPLEIEVNDKIYKEEYTLVAVCNGKYYGGGLEISPYSCIDDGKIHVCFVKAMSKPKTMALFPTLMIGKHTILKAVHFTTCKELKITLPPNETLCLDGNLYPKEGILHYKLFEKGINIFI